MKLNSSELVIKLADAASQIVSRDDTQYYAQETVEAHLRKSPRTNTLKSSIGDLEELLK